MFIANRTNKTRIGVIVTLVVYLLQAVTTSVHAVEMAATSLAAAKVLNATNTPSHLDHNLTSVAMQPHCHDQNASAGKQSNQESVSDDLAHHTDATASGINACCDSSDCFTSKCHSASVLFSSHALVSQSFLPTQNSTQELLIEAAPIKSLYRPPIFA